MVPENSGELKEAALLPHPGEIRADRPAAIVHPVAANASLLLEVSLPLLRIPKGSERLRGCQARRERRAEQRKRDTKPEPAT